jgi:N-acetylmuramoyl-L-alanine amidase
MNPYVHPSIQEGDRLAELEAATGGYFVAVDHMLHGPNVVHSLLPEATYQEVVKPRIAILHSNSGPRSSSWRNLFNWWRQPSVTGEPHFQVDLDGTVAQMMPLNRRADCNAKANRIAWSFETQDRGAASVESTEWTLEQLASMIGVLTALCVCYRLPCYAVTGWNASGIGYHSQFPEWSIYRGKTCPGAARIRQMDYVRARVAANLVAYGSATGWECGA